MNTYPTCWFVHVRLTLKPARKVAYIVAAYTERSARVQARKRLGKGPVITEVNRVPYAHAWRIDFADVLPPESGK